jgi:hypothetical protein
MTLKYTAQAAPSVVVSTELNSLPNITAALGSTVFDNSDNSTGRFLLADFEVTINTQTTRTGTPTLSLVIVPTIDTAYGDVSTQFLANSYVAKTLLGAAVTWSLDAASTARIMTMTGVVLPNAKFKLGLLNNTTQTLASNGNQIKMSGWYSYADV